MFLIIGHIRIQTILKISQSIRFIRFFSKKQLVSMKTILFYSSVKDKSLFQTQKFYQIDIHILEDLGYNVTLSNKIFDAFKFWKYDIVFGYFFRYSFFVVLIAKLFGKKSYLTGGIDALDIELVGEKEYKKQRLFFKLCYWVATKCIIVSSEDLKHVEEIVHKDKPSIVYSEHTIETSSFIGGPTVEKKEHNFVTIGWQGTNGNVKRKGIDKAVALFAYLKNKEEFKDSKMYILGRNGEGTPMIIKQIKDLQLDKDILIVGEVSEDEKIAYLKKNRFYFQLSQYEGFGIAALEGLVAGSVVIHSGKGGLKNPIYKDHVLVNIDSLDEKECERVYYQIMNLDYKKITESAIACQSYYDNARRKEDFKKIMKV